MSETIHDHILPALPGQQEFVHRMLTGSQAKTAFALRMNAERMIREGGLNRTVFMTLTVGDYAKDAQGHILRDESGKRRFIQVWDAEEASRRVNNLNRRVLGDLLSRAILVTERHKSGAIHFHLLGILSEEVDIRTGFDFDAVKRGDFRSVSPRLKRIWAYLRRTLPKYGFGRTETHPVRKTGEAVASYVSKYIEKNVCNRTPDDKRKKLVRYLGWDKSQLKPNEFSWGTPGACAWRTKARQLASLVLIGEREQMAQAFGPRWAFQLSRMMQAIDGVLRTEASHTFHWETWEQRERVRLEMARMNPGWCMRRENAVRHVVSFDDYDAAEWQETATAMRVCKDWSDRWVGGRRRVDAVRVAMQNRLRSCQKWLSLC